MKRFVLNTIFWKLVQKVFQEVELNSRMLLQKLPNVIHRLSTRIQSSHNCRDQVKPSLSTHLVKVRWEQCSRMTLGTWGLKALINTLNGKQATQLTQLFSQGTKGVEVVAVSALCPTLACEPAKGKWAPSSGSLHCSLISAGASGLQKTAEAGGSKSWGSPWSPNCSSVQANVSHLRC